MFVVVGGAGLIGLRIVNSLLLVMLLTGIATTVMAEDNAKDLKSFYRGKRILWVDSYDAGYAWSSGIEKGLRVALYGSGVELKIFQMDTKNHLEEDFHRQAGRRAKKIIEEFRPDVVIASDDNAQRFLVVPYLKDTALPVVFCGVNEDLANYGYPSSNVTGMIEDEMAEGLVMHLRRLAKGDRAGFIGADVNTNRIVADQYNQRFFDGRMRCYLVRSFAEFKEAFLQVQQEVDMLFFRNHVGLTGWDAAEAEAFVAAHTTVPSGSVLPWMQPFNLLTIAKVAEEQGEYAATTALRILAGARPADLPVERNRLAHLVVNLKMAKAAGLVLPVSLLQTAEVIGQEVYKKDAAPLSEAR
ncbi:hypothetical protein A7E78_07980 [Syntrophotalea acetylenivorans]|uniref:Uncharacterized protein n=1 Tax=Syntrophotalea acetylenivorans TaxID=1842532 RepID=A0A1L3GPH3_9BACT|nr:ABC transporter substrate binding protein [Syntrophotalea acetylenivorans]APG27780.1 hypothetical protein A7E78_07980 [Syntrophotalea acetylenivorans]